MPYIKPKEGPQEKMKRLLKGYEMNGPKLAAVLRCSEPTARTRLEEPSRLTLGDLQAIRLRAHIPAEELREAIRL